MKKLVVVAVVLLILGAAAGVLSGYMFDRAGTTGDRVVAHLDQVDALTESASQQPESSAGQTLAQAERYQRFADTAAAERDEQATVAWLLAAAAAVTIMAGLLLVFVRRARYRAGVARL